MCADPWPEGVLITGAPPYRRAMTPSFEVHPRVEGEGFRIDVRGPSAKSKSYFVPTDTQQDFAALFRWRASSFLRMRLICCLMFATGVFEPRLSVLLEPRERAGALDRLTQWPPGYQPRTSPGAPGPRGTMEPARPSRP